MAAAESHYRSLLPAIPLTKEWPMPDFMTALSLDPGSLLSFDPGSLLPFDPGSLLSLDPGSLLSMALLVLVGSICIMVLLELLSFVVATLLLTWQEYALKP